MCKTLQQVCTNHIVIYFFCLTVTFSHFLTLGNQVPTSLCSAWPIVLKPAYFHDLNTLLSLRFCKINDAVTELRKTGMLTQHIAIVVPKINHRGWVELAPEGFLWVLWLDWFCLSENAAGARWMSFSLSVGFQTVFHPVRLPRVLIDDAAIHPVDGPHAFPS